ncbi:MAG: porin, partial [Bacteroidales bacterium]|nr:porin [Bacteroidales bacterium]
MKRFAICVLLASSAMLAAAQVKSNNDKVPSGEPSLVERVAKIEKQNDWFNLYMNMNGSFNADFNQGGVNGLSQGAFRINQLRIEAKGKVNDWLSYRWRQRLNRDNDGSNDIDNAPTSIDIAGIGVKLSDKW